MDALVIYAMIAGGILLSLVFIRLLRSLAQWKTPVLVFIYRHIIYPYVISRHTFWGPWSRVGVFAHLIYVTVNAVLILFRGNSLEEIGRRAGSLSLINMILLLGAGHLSYAADLLGVSLTAYRKIHRAFGWMTMVLVVLHVGAFGFDLKSSTTESDTQDLLTIIAVSCLGALTLMSLPFVRNLSYELFLRAHQGFTIVTVYGIWQHVPKDALLPWLYLIIGISVLAITSSLYFVGLLYRNGIFSGNGCPRAVLSSNAYESIKNAAFGTPFKVRLLLPRPVKVKAGQYINLWLPGVSFWSWVQTHPFTIISWSQEKQSVLELLVLPRNGLTGTIARQLRAIGSGGYSSTALYSGPHGLSEALDDYENVLLVASDSGLPAVLPYARKLIHGNGTCTPRVRRVHLIWQVEDREIAIVAQEHVNELLKEDVADNGYVNIVLTELSGENIKKRSPLQDDQGQMLVMTSTSGDIRDKLRGIVRQHLHQRLNMINLEYQP
ncbi:uncharacterized protein N7458_002578 [Penicillium daleae]|uniref:ferric-chelate reductase (NADPH) n=1 Tax=Penicillium daleae TaxID=63821 RepID=A0AAD6CD00_9EURO|nr:uncharacterized protein N7458_002578 [Penicillium daleae]KAJ5461026.1 hypothetical protein N7458_002578 [Penicillium daleae]